MEYHPAWCPQCGETAVGILEEVRGLALIQSDGKGGYEYSGGMDVWWSTQQPATDEEGRAQLRCDNGHWWYATKKKGG